MDEAEHALLERLTEGARIPPEINPDTLLEEARKTIHRALERAEAGPKCRIIIVSDSGPRGEVELVSCDQSNPFSKHLKIGSFQSPLDLRLDTAECGVQSKEAEDVCCKPLTSDHLVRSYDELLGKVSIETKKQAREYTREEFAAVIAELALQVDRTLQELDPERYPSLPRFTVEIARRRRSVSVRAGRDEDIDMSLFGSEEETKPLWLEVLKPENMPTYPEVVGNDLAKCHLRESILQNITPPEQRERWGIERQHILLYGPPGTGKTMLAKATAREISQSGATVHFFSVNAAQLSSMWYGESEKNVQHLFNYARAHAPAVIFIDEVDSLCRSREISHEASQAMLNTFLRCMDGMEDSSGVTVIAATNRVEALDEAALRPGRFTKHIGIELPTQRELLEMIAKERETLPVVVTVDYDQLVRITEKHAGQWSGADIHSLFQQLRQTCFTLERSGETLRVLPPLLFEKVYQEYLRMREQEEHVMGFARPTPKTGA